MKYTRTLGGGRPNNARVHVIGAVDSTAGRIEGRIGSAGLGGVHAAMVVAAVCVPGEWAWASRRPHATPLVSAALGTLQWVETLQYTGTKSKQQSKVSPAARRFRPLRVILEVAEEAEMR